MTKRQNPLFRKEAMEKITSPDHLTEHLRVTGFGMWIILSAAVIFLVGMLVWASIGSLETRVQVVAIVQNQEAHIVAAGAVYLQEGMSVTIGEAEYTIKRVETDEFGRATAFADVALPDNTYYGTIVVDSTKPIEFLLERG